MAAVVFLAQPGDGTAITLALMDSQMQHIAAIERATAADASPATCHLITQLAARLPEEERKTDVVRELSAYGCMTQMHVVQLLAPQLGQESHAKDIDCNPSRIQQRREVGYAHTRHVL